MAKVAAVVLAAGRSSRYRAAGGAAETKLVAETEGKPIVLRVVEAALASRARPVIVVVGHASDAVKAALADCPITLVLNPDFASGLSSSLRLGLASTPIDSDGAVVLLGDMPKVTSSLIDELIAALESRPAVSAAAPVHGGLRGNPVLIARRLFEQAMRLTGDSGARRLLAALASTDIAEIAAASDVTFDVDTPADLALAQCAKRSGHWRMDD